MVADSVLCQRGDRSSGDWKDSGCNLSYVGYMQTCIKLQGRDKPMRILSVGGEIQKKVEGGKEGTDELHDVADVRVMGVREA